MTYREKITELRTHVNKLGQAAYNKNENSKEFKEYFAALLELNEFIGEVVSSGKELNDLYSLN